MNYMSVGAASCLRHSAPILGLLQLIAGAGVSGKCPQGARLMKGDEEGDHKEAEVHFLMGNQV